MNESSNYGFSADEFLKVSKEALAASSTYIKDAILGNVDLSEYLIKGDKTAVTVVDKESERISQLIVLAGFHDYGLVQEETSGILGNPNSPIRLHKDPLDGTGGFLMGGPTPTVIFDAYDTKNKKVLAVATMEPSTGRFWFSSLGNGAYMNLFKYGSSDWEHEDAGKPIKVNTKYISTKGFHILVDVDHGFTREALNGDKRRALFPEGRREISRAIESLGGKTASFYTNGGHYAYTAMGRPTLVGNITTAIGGPFDIAGLLHVKEAGGVAMCYIIDSESEGRKLVSCEEDIESADLVIASNNPKNLLTLEGILSKAVSING